MLLKWMILLVLFNWPLCLVQTASPTLEKDGLKPHIIMIVADDLGWNDVSFHGSNQIPTPNIDALAYSGVILNNYYVQPICTPSRSALLSGYHPIHTGLQHNTILGAEPYALPLGMKLLPEYLGDLGYISKHIGKWHLGFFKKEYTPTFRGFHSHYGYWTGRIDYYDHTAYDNSMWGHDFRRNMTVDRTAYGNYTTDLFTTEALDIIETHNASNPLFLYLAHEAVHSGNPNEPLQAPLEVVDMFSYIEDEERRTYAAMLWKLDDSVGKVIGALSERNMLENSIILFTSDNGGPAAGFNDNAASNWPLRGVKASVWEGGIRAAGCIWSPMFQNPGRVSKQMIQILDWLPTFYNAAGGNLEDLPELDGVNIWDSLVNDSQSPRTLMLHNIDDQDEIAGIRYENWKLIYKASGYGLTWDGWFGPSGRNTTESFQIFGSHKKWIFKSQTAKAIRKLMPKAFKNFKTTKRDAEILCGEIPGNATETCSTANPCLFQIDVDPCEYFDVSWKYPDRVLMLQELLHQFNITAVPPGNKDPDPTANPKYWGYDWTNWKDYALPNYDINTNTHYQINNFFKFM